MAGFQDIIGHEQIIAHLKNAIAMDQVSHAYILNGPEHSGKMMLAKAFAMALQCEAVQNEPGLTEACMECRSCKQAAGGNQPDIIYVTHEKPKTISVDEIRRQLVGDMDIRPYSSKYKIYIVDEAEKMNPQAQNALLKTIEEPPAYGIILLLTTNADMFLQTIRSRCVQLNLKAVPDRKLRDYIMRECQVPDYQADLCVAFAQGNVGRAMELAVSEDFRELKEFCMQLLRKMERLEEYDFGPEIQEMLTYKDNMGDLLDLFLFWFRDVLLYKSTGREQGLIFRDMSFDIRRQADRISYVGLDRIIAEIGRVTNRLQANVNAELTLELLLMLIKEQL